MIVVVSKPAFTAECVEECDFGCSTGEAVPRDDI